MKAFPTEKNDTKKLFGSDDTIFQNFFLVGVFARIKRNGPKRTEWPEDLESNFTLIAFVLVLQLGEDKCQL